MKQKVELKGNLVESGTELSAIPLLGIREIYYSGFFMKKIALGIKGGILSLLVLSCFFVGIIGYDALDTLTNGRSIVLESSDGAVVKITNVQKRAVEFISGTGGVTAFAPTLVPVVGLLFLAISSLAVFGAFSLFSRLLKNQCFPG